MEVLRKTLVQGCGDIHMGQFKSSGGTKTEVSATPQKSNRNSLLQAVSSYLQKTYRETAGSEDKISAEEIHFNVNRSETITENVSFITASRLVKSTFKNAHYDKETKMFHGLERIYPGGDMMKERSVKYSQPRWSASLLSMLSQLFENQMLCDTYIKCKNKLGVITFIPCHSCVLAASSHVLLSNLTEKRMILKEASKLSIECEGISLHEWNTILQFIYKGNVDICLKNVLRILTVARFLRIQGLTVLLENMMKDNDIMVSSKWRSQCIDQGLIIVKSYKEHPTHLIHTPPFMNNTPLLSESLLNVNPELANPKQGSLNAVKSEGRHSPGSAMPVGMPADSLRSIAEQVITSYGQEQSEHCNATAEDTGQNTEEQEPKSKKRKMYKPRKVAQSDNTEHSNVIGTVQVDSSLCRLSPETCSGEAGNRALHESLQDEDETLNEEYLDTSRSIKEELSTDDRAEYASRDASDVYIDRADDGHPFEFPKPVVIAPIDDDTSPSPTPDFHIKQESETGALDKDDVSHESRSMLYGLLNTDKQKEADTPMLKSLLASRAAATQSPSLGLTPQFVERHQSDSESDLMTELYSLQQVSDTGGDPDYKPASSKKKKRKRGSTVHKKSDPAEVSPPTIREMAPHKVQNIFTWSAEDLQRERKKLSKNMDIDFSASSLLLSMITKATPTSNANPSTKAKVGHPAEDAQKSDSHKSTEKSPEQNSLSENVSTPASQILVSLLGNRKDSNSNSNNSADDQGSCKAKSSSSRKSLLNAMPTKNSPGGLLFSQVLQGMASAYSSPIGNKTPASLAHPTAPLLPSLLNRQSDNTRNRTDTMVKDVKEQTVSVSGSQSKSHKKPHKSKRKNSKEQDKSSHSPGLKLKMTFQKTGGDYSVKSEPVDECVSGDEQRRVASENIESAALANDYGDEEAAQINDTTRALIDLASSPHHWAGSVFESVTASEQSPEEERAGSPASNTSGIDCAAENVAKTWSHLQSLLEPKSPSSPSNVREDYVAQRSGDSHGENDESLAENGDSHVVSADLIQVFKSEAVEKRTIDSSKGGREFERESSPSDTEAPREPNDQSHVLALSAPEDISNSSLLRHHMADTRARSHAYSSSSGRTVRSLLTEKETSNRDQGVEQEKDRKWKEYLGGIADGRKSQEHLLEQEKERRWKEYLDGIMKNASLP